MKIQDIQLSDKTLWQDFVTKYESGDYYGALAVLQNAQLVSKANTASVTNAMIKAVDDLQDLYYTNVEDKLADGLATFQESIDNIANQGEYDATKQYAQGNFVLYNGNVYMYIANTPSTGNLPTDTAYWVNLGLKGDTGAPSLDLNLRYNWQSNLQYNSKDVVYYGDSMYWAKQTSTGREPGFGKQGWPYMAYGNGRFVMLSDDGKYATYSTDGVNWGAVKMPEFSTIGLSSSDSHWTGLCYGNGIFVVAGYHSGYLAYSRDGIYWTLQNVQFWYWHNIAYGDGKFIVTSKSQGIFLYSEDGMNWQYKQITNGGALDFICYGNGKFVIAGTNIYYSEDGLNWTQSSKSFATREFPFNLIYGNNKFLIDTYSYDEDGQLLLDGQTYISTDGITWTLNETTGFTNLFATRTFFANDKFYYFATYVPGSTENYIYKYSEDAETWVNVYPSPFLGIVSSSGVGVWKGAMIYGNNKYIVTNLWGIEAMISDDALTWTETFVSNDSYWGILIQNLPADITVSQSTPTKPYQGQLWWQVD